MREVLKIPDSFFLILILMLLNFVMKIPYIEANVALTGWVFKIP